MFLAGSAGGSVTAAAVHPGGGWGHAAPTAPFTATATGRVLHCDKNSNTTRAVLTVVKRSVQWHLVHLQRPVRERLHHPRACTHKQSAPRPSSPLLCPCHHSPVHRPSPWLSVPGHVTCAVPCLACSRRNVFSGPVQVAARVRTSFLFWGRIAVHHVAGPCLASPSTCCCWALGPCLPFRRPWRLLP